MPLFTTFMTLGVATCFLWTSGPYLWATYSPAVPLVAAYLVASTLLYLGRAWGTDPGILSRASKAEGDILRGRWAGAELVGCVDECAFWADDRLAVFIVLFSEL